PPHPTPLPSTTLFRSAYYDAPAAREDQTERIQEALVEPRYQAAHRIGLDREHLARELKRGSRNCLLRSIVHREKPRWPAPGAPFIIGSGVYQTESAPFPT